MIKAFFNSLLYNPNRKIMIYIFIFSFILRFGYSYYTYVHISPGDSYFYNNLYYLIALDIIDQETIFYETDHPYKDVVGPVIPVINAVTMAILGNTWLSIFITTSLASSLLVLIMFKMGLQLFDRSTGLLASCWAAVSPLYIYFNSSPGKDIFMSLLLLLILDLFINQIFFNRFSYFRFIIFSALFVISFHLDERFIVFTPVILFFIVFYETEHFKKLAFQRTILFLGLMALFMLPWIIRNYCKFDRIVLLTTRTERVTDWILGNPHKQNVIDNAYSEELYHIKDTQIDSVLKGYKKTTDGGWQISDTQRKAMLNGNLPHTFQPMEAYWSRFTAMMRPFQTGGVWERTGYFYSENSLRHNIASFTFYGTMLFFSFPGFYHLYKRNKRVFYLFISFMGIYILIHVLSIPYTNWRYRLPLDALFIIVGSFGILKTIKSIFSGEGNNILTCATFIRAR